jgi:hypothetical protein
METQILDFFKTFSDLTRLRVAALLAEQALSAEEITARLGLRQGEIYRHLAMIEKLGLLRKQDEQFSLDAKALESLSRGVLAGQRPAVEVRSNDPNAEAFDHKALRSFSLPDGRLREIPLHEKKRLAVLRHVVQIFEPGVHYSEKEVNEALKRFHDDYATLRRSLYDARLLERAANGSEYWRDK